MQAESSEHILGKRIRSGRERLKLSLDAFAYEAGIDSSYLNGIELGKRNPSFKVLCLIAKRLGTTLSSLVVDLPGDEKVKKAITKPTNSPSKF